MSQFESRKGNSKDPFLADSRRSDDAIYIHNDQKWSPQNSNRRGGVNPDSVLMVGCSHFACVNNAHSLLNRPTQVSSELMQYIFLVYTHTMMCGPLYSA